MGFPSFFRPSQLEQRHRYWLLALLALLTTALVGSASVRATGPAASLTQAREALDGSATISIIGDSTGNDLNEWVALWAADLGADRQVTLNRWLDGRYRADPVRYGDRGDAVTIWNASHPGGAASWAVDQLAAVQPECPDLVILNLGHNNTEANVAPQLEQLHLQLSEGVPVVLVLQNPGRGAHRDPQAATLRSAAEWAAIRRVPTIDVTASFTKPDRQMLDDIHPNEIGSRTWADTVNETFSS